MEIIVLDIRYADQCGWVSVLGVSLWNADAHLLHVERSHGRWRFDLLWLRPLVMKLRGF